MGIREPSGHADPLNILIENDKANAINQVGFWLDVNPIVDLVGKVAVPEAVADVFEAESRDSSFFEEDVGHECLDFC
jgi:hypothetical protein